MFYTRNSMKAFRRFPRGFPGKSDLCQCIYIQIDSVKRSVESDGMDIDIRLKHANERSTAAI